MLHDKNTHFTHNVQGFNFEKEVHNLMIYLHGLILHVDIVFLQEHKVRVQKNNKLVWKDVTNWVMKTSPNYRNLHNEKRIGQGSTYVLSGLHIYVIADPIALPW